MGRFGKLPGIDDENTTRRNVLVGTGYAFGGLFVLGAAGDDGDDETTDSSVDSPSNGDGNSDSGGSSGASNEDTETDESTEEPTEEPTETEQNTTHEIGESFEVGSGAQSIRYTVQEALVADKVGTEALSEEADGKFVIVILTMENIGDESLDITSRNLRLVDSEKREFESDIEAATYLEQDPRIDVEPITFDQLQPGLEVERAVIFDVAPGESYAFKANPEGLFSTADSHYVPLGEVSE